MWGPEAVDLFRQAAQEAIKYGAKQYSDEILTPGDGPAGADAGWGLADWRVNGLTQASRLASRVAGF